MAQVLAIANQKGGVGKTTTSVNVACALARLNQRVLLVDLDPQGNATMGSGVDKRTLAASVYQVLIGEVRAREAIVAQTAAGYALLPANRELAGAELDLVERDARLAESLRRVKARLHADAVEIICAPALGVLQAQAPASFDLVFLDPPYGQGLLGPALAAAARVWCPADGCMPRMLSPIPPTALCRAICRIRRPMCRNSSTFWRELSMITASAASVVTSLFCPKAMPIEAASRAGASLIPSPT
jgi:hypothetical protein